MEPKVDSHEQIGAQVNSVMARAFQKVLAEQTEVELEWLGAGKFLSYQDAVASNWVLVYFGTVRGFSF